MVYRVLVMYKLKWADFSIFLIVKCVSQFDRLQQQLMN